MAHLLAHRFGVIGLVLIALGTLQLVFSAPRVTEYQKDGTSVPPGAVMSERPATPAEHARNLRRHKCQVWGFRLAIAALVVGFVLQLIDLLT